MGHEQAQAVVGVLLVELDDLELRQQQVDRLERVRQPRQAVENSSVWHIWSLSSSMSIAWPCSPWVKYSCLSPYSALKFLSGA